MGEATIMWIWKSYDSIEYPLDSDLISSIALLLVREGKEELMWDWIDQESQKPASDTANVYFDKRYRLSGALSRQKHASLLTTVLMRLWRRFSVGQKYHITFPSKQRPISATASLVYPKHT
jgi:hypothetical protein